MNLEFNVQITPFKIIFAALMLVGGGLAKRAHLQQA